VRRKDGAFFGVPVRAWSTLINAREGIYEMSSRMVRVFRRSASLNSRGPCSQKIS
jgi:hypothetical protein